MGQVRFYCALCKDLQGPRYGYFIRIRDILHTRKYTGDLGLIHILIRSEDNFVSYENKNIEEHIRMYTECIVLVV